MKVLVIRFSSIGDIVLTSPVVRCLKLQKGAEIHFLTKKAFTPVLAASPYVDHIHAIEKDISEILPALKKENFDVLIDLHKNLRSWQVRGLLRKRVITFDKGNIRKWLMVRLKMRRFKVDHIVKRYMDALRPLGIEYDGAGLDYFLLPAGVELPVPNGPYVCFGIGGTHFTKRLPAESIRRICMRIQIPVYLLGGKEDKEVAEEIASGLPQVHNYCGGLNLSDSARLVKGASVVLTHDTAIMHIAAAFEKSIYSIWGNTVPEFGMFPWYPDDSPGHFDIAEVKDLSCRPCSKIGFSQCPKGHFRCMKSQDIEAIANRITMELSKI